jgi:hypothetical protein
MSSHDVPRVGSGIFPSTQNAKNEPSKFKTLGFAVLIIFGVGGLAVAGIGAGGLLHAGSLINLGQVNSIVMLVIGGGGGILLLVIGIVGFVDTRSNTKISDKTTIQDTKHSNLEESGDTGLQQSQPAERRSVQKKCEQSRLTLQEQARHEALSLRCQQNKLPNVALMLEKIKTFMGTLSKTDLIRMSDRVTDQELDGWTTATTKYLDDRWAWPAASGGYSVIRQLITDPNLNAPLQDPWFILALFRRNQSDNPIEISGLNVAEMLTAGFRDQHPALLEGQPYNNAFFAEDINMVHDQAHEERLLKCFLVRKECSFVLVIRAIEIATQKIGVTDVGHAAVHSRFDDIYGSTLWENGDIVACFQQLKQCIDSEEKFSVQGHTFVNSYGQSLRGFITLCRILYPESDLVDARLNFAFVSSTDLVEKIANHPTLLLEYDICHLWYDVMHLKAMFAGQSHRYPFKDGQFSLIDIVEKILSHIQKTGLKPENAITAQQLYLRLYALADLK